MRKNNFLIPLFLVFLKINAFGQVFIESEMLYEEINKFSTVTEFDKSIIQNELNIETYINTVEKWQKERGYYFTPETKNEIYTEIGLSIILLNKLSDYSFSDSAALSSDSFIDGTNQLLENYLDNIISNGKITPLVGEWLGTFQFNIKSNIGNDIAVEPFKNVYYKKKNERGSITVNSDVKQCSIFIDGKDSELTTNKTVSVKTGSRTVVVKKDGYQDCPETVEVKKRKTVSINCKMKKK
ncbi:MAG: PEGA domain-containing protein [Bacteroidota bacterium]